MNSSQKRRIFIPLLLAVAMMLTGCLGIWTSHYNVAGTVMEEDTGVPLVGALVTMGLRRAVTDARGNFELKTLAAGQRELKVELDGYEPTVLSVDLSSNKTVDVGLASALPPIQNDGLMMYDINRILSDRDTVTYTALFYQINMVRFLVPSASFVQADRMVAIVNGQPIDQYPGHTYTHGAVPLAMGENTFQIRVWDSEGHARTSALYTYYVDINPLDLRVFMTWAGGADLDLHMFKRDSEEPNVFTHGGSDRHVYFNNMRPHDFGIGEDRNPVYEWDGAGYSGWENIILPVLTPGEYHIWVLPYEVYEQTTGQLKVIFNAASPTPTEATFDLMFDLEDEKNEYYVITVRVDEKGEATLVEVEPGEAL